MSDEIEFEDVIAYINDMGSENHLAMFMPEERHEEFIELQRAFIEALGRFKETVKKWGDESYQLSQKFEAIQLVLKRGIKSPAVFIQEIEKITGVKRKKEASA